ncbi:MAG: ABC transporter permease [Oscillospiraceae bacterium]|nr:ABC transporter permease [Oscillospiraceae bacterium]
MSKKVRSFLTMLGIIIGVAAVMTLVSITQAQNEKSMEWINSMGTNIVNVYASSWYNPKISSEIEEFVTLELADVTKGVTPDIQYWGARITYDVKTAPEVRMYFGSADFGICKNFTIGQGRDLSYLDIQRGTRVAVLGSRVKQLLFDYKDPIGEWININGERFMVVGVYQSKFDNQPYSDDDLLVIPYTHVRMMMRQTSVEQYIIKAKDSESTAEAAKRLKEFLATKFEQEWYYSVWSMDEWRDQLDEVNRGNLILLGSIAGISLIVGGIGIMNIMLVTVTERTREIGIRKAIGAERRSIISQFLIEASVLSFIGGLIGVFFGFLATLFWGKISYDVLVLPNWPMTAAALVFSIGLGIIFGLFPAIKASALQPVVALRNE